MWANAQLDGRPRGAVSIVAMSSSDRLTRKPIPRIKHRVTSCHTAEVTAIRTFSCLISHAPSKHPISVVGSGTPTVFGIDIVAQIEPIVLDFPIPSRYRIVDLKVSTLRLQISENWGFRSSNFEGGGGKYEHPTYVVWSLKFRENRFRDVAKYVSGEKK